MFLVGCAAKNFIDGENQRSRGTPFFSDDAGMPPKGVKRTPLECPGESDGVPLWLKRAGGGREGDLKMPIRFRVTMWVLHMSRLGILVSQSDSSGAKRMIKLHHLGCPGNPDGVCLGGIWVPYLGLAGER